MFVGLCWSFVGEGQLSRGGNWKGLRCAGGMVGVRVARREGVSYGG